MKDKKQKNEQNAGAIAAKPKKKKKVLIVVLVIVAVLVVWIGISIHNATKQVAMAVNTVEVEPVQKRDLSDTISVKGTVAGASSTNVTSKAASEITSMNVQVGDIVKEGDVLCTLDSTSIEEKIADLEKSVSNANAVSSINTQQAADALQRFAADNRRMADDLRQQTCAALENSLRFIRQTFGEEQELWILLSGFKSMGADQLLHTAGSELYAEIQSEATPQAKAEALRRTLQNS